MITLNKSKNVIPDLCYSTDYVNWAIYPVNIIFLCTFMVMLFSSSSPVVKAHISIQKKKLQKLPVVFWYKPQENIPLFFFSCLQHSMFISLAAAKP